MTSDRSRDEQERAYDPTGERRRQASQAEGRPDVPPSASQHGGELEPRDSRNVTGQAGAGTGAPGGAEQQEGAERWGGDARQDQSVAARQPTGEHPAAQDPAILRRELKAEQQAQQQQQQ